MGGNHRRRRWCGEKDGNLAFSTTTNFLIEKLKEEKKKSLKAGEKQEKQKPQK